MIATPARAETVERHVTELARDRRAYVTNCVSGTAYLSVQGPDARALLQPFTPADLASEHLPYFRFMQTTVADVPTLLSRTGYSGELGYELYYPRDFALHMWDSLIAAGATPCGLGALRSTRMEKKYPLYGLDVSETTSPLEAGLGWAVDLDAEPFIGRDAFGASVTKDLPGSSPGGVGGGGGSGLVVGKGEGGGGGRGGRGGGGGGGGGGRGRGGG